MIPTTNYTTYLHPLETGYMARRQSISSDMSDEEFEPTRKCNANNWNHLLAQFDSQPDMIKLIQSCKEEEERRCEEETKMRLKEYQVFRQLQYIQEKHYFEKKTLKDFNLELPPLYK